MRTADLLHRFIEFNVYNGAPGKGQALYNDGGNPWLHGRIEEFLKHEAAAFETCDVCMGTGGYWADRWMECGHCEGQGRVDKARHICNQSEYPTRSGRDDAQP